MTILSPTTRTSRTHAECLSMEGDDPSILEWDDYFNGLTSYSSELYTLRQRLARSEQMELANAQHSVGLGMQCQMEKERLELKLRMATQNSETDLGDLNAARAESEALLVYKTWVTELLEELRKRDAEVEELTREFERRDVEVECLKDEIGQLNGRYKKQLVESLLWDDEFDDGDIVADSVAARDVRADDKGANNDEGNDGGVPEAEMTKDWRYEVPEI